MEYQVNLKGLILFESKSWLGRAFFNKKPTLKNKENYLNLGCGFNIVDGYINADFFRFKFWKKNILKTQWQLDLRYPLNCDNELFNGIFTEHTIEHLYPSQAKILLRELYRILKTDSFIRITVPDIEKYVKFYSHSLEGINEKEFNKKYHSGCSAIASITQDFFHFSTWDFEELKNYLEEIGFKNVQRKEFGQTADPRLNLDRQERAWHTLYVEAQK